MTMNKLLVAVPLAALLGACGGGAGAVAEAVVERAVPASATASPQAYAQFANSEPADDRAEPLEVGMLTPPTSESAEPVDLR